MKEETIKVTSFRGLCYGFKGLPIKIAFHDDYGPVDYEKGRTSEHGT